MPKDSMGNKVRIKTSRRKEGKKVGVLKSKGPKRKSY